MAELDVILAPALAPEDLIGLELHWLDAIAAGQTAPVLLIYSTPGRWVSIGRYHQFSEMANGEGVNVFRRLTGGRVVGAGEGWLGLALVLPSCVALLKEDTTRLKPEQIMNRYARGLLTALRALGVDCFYPGRDAITFERREIAMCTFETDAAGAMLFEATVAHNRGMEELVHDLERVDPAGALSCRMYDAASATKVVRELGRDVSFDELAEAIAAGYGITLGATGRRALTAIEAAQGQYRGRAQAASSGLRAVGAGLILRNRIAAQLGAIEAAVALDADKKIEAVRLSGDFIANSPAIAQLESELRGRTLEPASIGQTVTKIFGDNQRRNFFLGAGAIANLERLIAGVN